MLSWQGVGKDMARIWQGDAILKSMARVWHQYRKVCDAGFERANDIINRCAMLLPEPVCA